MFLYLQVNSYLMCSVAEGQTAVDVTHGFEVGFMVEVPMAEGLPRYGVIRWIGQLPQVKDKLVAGLELVRRIISKCLSHIILGGLYRHLLLFFFIFYWPLCSWPEFLKP